MPETDVAARLDDAAFTAMLQRALPDLQQFLRRLCGTEHDADDVLQETLTKVWRLRAGFDSNHDGGAWLHQAAFRCFCDHRRRQRRQPRPAADLVDALVARQPCPTELRDELERRLQVLTSDTRALLLAFHRDGRTLRQLAEEHRVPSNTVKSWLHRARQRLAEARP
jgi:RNA polymerase sigma-70 factor (ECF subfamily)